MWRRALTGCMGATHRGVVEYDVNDDHFIQTSISDVSLWRKNSKKACHQSSGIIDFIVREQRADYLGVVVKHGWDVNKRLQVFVFGFARVKWTALYHAVFFRWHEGVRLLIEAGANCNIRCKWSWSPGVAELYSHFEPPDMKHTPMCVAIQNDDLEMVRLLLQNGLDLEDTSCDHVNHFQLLQTLGYCSEIALQQNSEILNELLTNGPGVRSNLNKQLQSLLQDYLQKRQFLPKHLDVLFTHGVHIDQEYQGSSLYHTFTTERRVNTARWLIRHGASCPFPMSHIKYMDSPCDYQIQVWEVLLQVGAKHSDSLKVHLGEVEMIIQDYLQQGDSWEHEDGIMCKIVKIYQKILGKDRQIWIDESKRRRKTFPTHRELQMAHLREFSDNSLDVYPEEVNMRGTLRERCEKTLKIISHMVHFLNQPHTLQWHCRVCLRESLVSLSPSLIRTLSGPAALKRYILCHEL